MSHTTFPLLPSSDPDAPIAWQNGHPISQRRFLQQAWRLTEHLPQNEYAIHLCEDRYRFLLVFVAMLLRGKTCLLPANRSVSELQSVSTRYGNCPCIVDKPQPDLNLEQYTVKPEGTEDDVPVDIPEISASQRCVVVFTSGSTGQSVPWEKSWGELYRGAKLTQRMLALDESKPVIVATVPPQHMYGLEISIILPLVAGVSMDGGRPFFPQELQYTLHSVPQPRFLATTPVHLHACLETDITWPRADKIISATAPLHAELAERAEHTFDCPLQEIYGSTETGAIATRRTRMEHKWTLHQGLEMQPGVNGSGNASVSGGHLPHPVALHDRIRYDSDNRFTLLGRNSDMIKIAGKRVSLGDLNHKLQSIPGVKDGVFVELPATEQRTVPRLCAVVVAPELTQKEILDALRIQIDPIYLPRPLYQIAQLPRTETGKIPQEAMLELLARLRKN